MSNARLIVIDSAVAVTPELSANWPEGSITLHLKAGVDPLAQIEDAAAALAANGQPVDTLDLVSHGGDGFLVLNGERIDESALQSRTAILKTLGTSLAPGADILLYGCYVAADANGESFLQVLAQATGVDVSASTNATGSAVLGGDSVLEASVGFVESVPLNLSALAGLLAIPANGNVAFATATSNGNGTFNVGGFFTVSAQNGEAPASGSPLVVNSDGAYINDTFTYTNATTPSPWTSYIQLAVTGTGSFRVTGAVIGEYATGGDVPSNAYYNVYAVGLANGVLVAQTNTHSSISAYETDYQLDFSSFGSKRIDTFRVYYSWSGAATSVHQDSFSFASLAIADASTAVATNNVAPVIANLDNDSVTFFEGGTPLLIDAGSNATLTDNDSTSFNGGTLTAHFGANGLNSEDVLGIRNEGTAAGQISVSGGNVSYGSTVIGTVTGGVAGADLVVTFNAASSPAAAQALIRNLTYSNSNTTTPLTLARTVSVTVTDGAGGTSNTSNVTVNVTDVNDAPTVSATGLNPTYTENGSPAFLFSGVAVATVETGQNIRELKLTVANIADAGSEYIAFDGSNIVLTSGTSGTTNGSAFSYSVSVTSGTATVTLIKTGGVAASTVQTLLGSAGYLNTSHNPTTATDRVVTLTSISDTGGTANGGVDTTSVAVTSSVHLVAVNDAPTLSGGPYLFTPPTDEDTPTAGTLVSTLLGGTTYADVDSASVGIAVTAVNSHGNWQYSTNGTTGWTNFGAVSSTTALLLSESTYVRYVPDSANGETATLTFRAWDKSSGTASANAAPSTINATSNGGSTSLSSGTATASLAVTSVNDAPTNITLSNNSIAENSGAGAARTVGTLTTTDVDTGDTFTYSFVGGTDDGLFQIVGNELRFKNTTTLDFETKANYSVKVRTTDSGNLTFDQTFTVLLTDVNENPVVAVPLTAQSAAVGQSYSYTVPAGTFTDPDSGQTATLTYSAALASGGALPSWLSFNAATRVFSGTPASGDTGTPSVRVTATDSGGLSVYSDFTLSVVNGPSVAGIVRAGSAAQLSNAASPTFTITFSESVSGVTFDDFTLTGTSTGGVVGTPVSSDGGLTWTVSVSGASEGTLGINLNSSGTGIQSTANSAAIIGGYTGGQSYTLDRTAPAAPSITTAALTNQSAPTLGGTAETNAIVTVVLGGATYTTTATGGAWSINLASAAPASGTLALNANGSNAVSVTATDAATNVSTAATQTLVIDTTPPAAPVLTSAALTNQTLPTLAGTAEAGAAITVVVGTGNATYTTVADGSGAWSLNLATATPASGTLTLDANGTNGVSVTARDAANNLSQAATQTLTIDTTPPTQTFSLAHLSSDTGASNSDFITKTASQTITATLSAGLGVGDKVHGSLDGGATWIDITAKVAGTALTWDGVILIGSGTLKIKVTDAAGNDGTALSQAYLLDAVPPAIRAGSVSLDSDSGSSASDFITNNGTNQTLRGTLNGNLSAGEIVEVSVDNGATWTTATATVASSSWSLAGVTLAGSGTLQVRVSDTAGNSSVALSQTYTIDTVAPVFDRGASSPADDATGVGLASALVVRFNERLGSVDATQVYLRDVATQNLVAATVTLNAFGELVITPTANLVSLTDYYVTWDANALKDVAGNAAAPVGNTTTLNFKTELLTPTTPTNPPSPPSPPPPAPPAGSVVVDGVSVTTTTQADGSTKVTIPVVQADRQETTGAATTADIPLVTGAAGQPLLSVGVPAGVGITAEGFATPQSAAAALADLGVRLQRVDGTATSLVNDGQVFLATLDPSATLIVQLVTLSVAGAVASGEPIRITGSTSSSVHEAVILDARSLPSGTVLQVDDIDFVAVVGAVRVIGGAGQNVASGDDGAQWIVLGADDDVLHGGGGNDTIGSLGGNDQVFGDAGNDTVFGGAGNDTLSGGAGNDRLNGGQGWDLALQSGKATDWTVTTQGEVATLVHKTTGETDTFIAVDRIQFDIGASLYLAHSDAEAALAHIVTTWLGRDLTAAEGNAIQQNAGLTPMQVAQAVRALPLGVTLQSHTAAELIAGWNTNAAIVRLDVQTSVQLGDGGVRYTPSQTQTVKGGKGIDTVVLAKTNAADVHLERSADGSGWEATRLTDGQMVAVQGVERLQFSNGGGIALDLAGNAGTVVRLIGAVFGKDAVHNASFVGIGLQLADAGWGTEQLGALALQKAGITSTDTALQLLWTNLTGHSASAAELAPLQQLAAAGWTTGQFASLAAGHALNAANIDLVGLAQTGVGYVLV